MPTSAAVRTVLAVCVSAAGLSACQSRPVSRTERAGAEVLTGPDPSTPETDADPRRVAERVDGSFTATDSGAADISPPAPSASGDDAAAVPDIPTLAVRWPLDEVELVRTFGWSIDPARHVDEHHDDVLLRSRDGTFVLAPFSGEVVRVSRRDRDGRATSPTSSTSSRPGDGTTTLVLRKDELEVELEGRMASLVSPGMRVDARAAVAITRGRGPLRVHMAVDGVPLDPLQIVGTLESDLAAVLSTAAAVRRPAAPSTEE